MNESKKRCPHCGAFVALIRITRFPMLGQASVYFEANCNNRNCRRTVKMEVTVMGLAHVARRYGKKGVAKSRSAE